MILDNIVKAAQYARLVSAISKYSDEIKKDLGIKNYSDIEKYARRLIYG